MRHAYAVTIYTRTTSQNRIPIHVAKMADTQIVLVMAVAVICKRKENGEKYEKLERRIVYSGDGRKGFSAVDAETTFRRIIKLLNC